jgi:hypothetical protein
MPQNVTNSFAIATLTHADVAVDPPNSPVGPAVYTAISFGDAARALGADIAAQYQASKLVVVSKGERAAAKNFGTALTSLAAASRCA